MFDFQFSFQFIFLTFFIILLSTGLALFCAWLNKKLHHINLGHWLMEHVYCPLGKTVILIIIMLLLFPVIDMRLNYNQLLTQLYEHNFLSSMTNILFVSGLILSFVPVLSHPAITMPLLGCITTGLVFAHLYRIPAHIDISWIPEGETLLKIIIIIMITYFICRWLNENISLWVNQKFNVSGSSGLVSDINYLIFQIPVVLAYATTLLSQLQTNKLIR